MEGEMNFELTREQKELQKVFRDFAQKYVAPRAIEVDESHEFPVDTVERMQAIGMLGIPFDEKYGGVGGDIQSYVLAVEELSKACATTGVIVSAHTSLCAGLLDHWANEDQKEKYLRPLVSGEKLGAFALTEPDAGTDAAGQKSVARLEGDHYILNGSKIFITNANYADTYIVFAMTDRSQGTRGISAFIVEKDFEGFEMGTKEKKLGIHGSATYELVFRNVRIPKENLIGKEGQGFRIAMHTLDGGRIGIAAQALGIAQGAIDKTVKFVKERKQFGRPISAFQNTQFTLANLEAMTQAARLLVYKAAWCKDNGKPYGVEAATAKLVASEVAMYVTTKCVQLHGGYGYTQEYEVERMMRDAKITEIYEGTSEVMRMVISGNLLR